MSQTVPKGQISISMLDVRVKVIKLFLFVLMLTLLNPEPYILVFGSLISISVSDFGSTIYSSPSINKYSLEIDPFPVKPVPVTKAFCSSKGLKYIIFGFTSLILNVSK